MLIDPDLVPKKEKIIRGQFAFKESDYSDVQAYAEYASEQLGEDLSVSATITYLVMSAIKKDKSFKRWQKQQKEKNEKAESNNKDAEESKQTKDHGAGFSNNENTMGGI